MGDGRVYSRDDLERVAFEAGGAVSAVFMREDREKVMPAEECRDAVQAVLEDFDAQRGAALGFTAEQLSGTRDG